MKLIYGLLPVALAQKDEVRGGVVKFLEQHKQKVIAEKNTAEKNWAAKSQWFDGSIDKLTDMGVKRNEELSEANDELTGATEMVKSLEGQIQEMTVTIDKAHQNIEAANAIRNEEATRFAQAKQDLDDMIEALEKVKEIIATMPDAIKVPTSGFLQLQQKVEKKLSPLGQSLTSNRRQEAWAKVAEVLREVHNPFAMLQQPTSYAFKSDKGSRLTSLVRELKTAAEGDRTELVTQEQNKIANYQQLKSNTQVEIASTEKQRTTAKNNKAKEQQKAADAERLKGELEQVIAADAKLLSKQKRDRASTEKIHESNDKQMADEITAVDSAISILSGKAVSGATGKQVAANTLTQTSFIQIRNQPMTRVAEFLRTRGANLRSKMLVQLAESVGTGGPFDKVKTMIKEMILKLQEEAAAETDKNGFCVNALKQNKENTENAEGEVREFTAAQAQAEAKAKEAAKKHKEFTEELEESTKEFNEQERIRLADQKDNEESVADLDAGIAECEKASQVLQSFYAGSSLIQQPAATELATDSSGGYAPQARSGSGTGVVEVVENLLAKMEATRATLMASENLAKTSHADTSRLFRERDNTLKSDIDAQKKEEASQTTAAGEARSNLNDAQTQLQSFQNEYDQALEPQCKETGVSFETRAQARQEEIQSLQEALQILQEM